MAVIWGLDLKEIQWGKFKNSYMWNNEYHRRRTKFIVYQLAMIFCVVSESLGTAALDDYIHQQKYVKTHTNPPATIHNNNFIGIASYNVFVGVYVATIFGSAFFFDLFWPERTESPAVKLAWRICSVLACLFTLASALAFTIILATKSAYITGSDTVGAQRALSEYGGGPLKYRRNPRAIASVAFLWPGMLATIASTYLLWRSLAHIDEHGPKSKHARMMDVVAEMEKPSIGTPNSSTVTADTGRHHNEPRVPAVDGSQTLRPVEPSMSPEPGATQEVGKPHDEVSRHPTAGSKAFEV